jgi:hypothetical protein
VAEARRATDQLSAGGELETFRNGLLGLLHVMIPTSGAGQDKRRARAWQGESAAHGMHFRIARRKRVDNAAMMLSVAPSTLAS